MDISILGYKLNLEVLILIGVIYLIMVGHTFCGCCNYGMMEGFDNSSTEQTKQAVKQNVQEKGAAKKTELQTQVAAGGPTTATTTTSTKTEGFTGANTNYGQSSPYDLSQDMPINTSSWSAQNMTVTPGQPLSAGVKQFLAREPQPVPLPEGEMLMFANTPFKPECCPNTYSNSSGCACLTGPQYNYLILRGGNNVPYSEY
jgi:uncharacterized protein (UPF0333 family)